jgi:CheY-like chemotaxis protein
VPFERLGAEQTATEGTGIGLPLARALTEAMAGQLSAASTPGVGSAFTVSLPRTTDLEPAPPAGHPVMASLVPAVTGPATPPRAAAGPGHGRQAVSVLYIEDNPANVEVVARFLKNRRDISLHAVSCGQDGLDYAAREGPSIILLDLHLPGMAGEHVLQELKAEPATAAIPVAILSADASPGTIRRLIASGALTYLTKPLVLADLDELLGSLSNSQQRPGL